MEIEKCSKRRLEDLINRRNRSKLFLPYQFVLREDIYGATPCPKLARKVGLHISTISSKWVRAA